MGKGFTLIELIMIIVILGILAIVAIPRYIDLRSDALEAAADGVVGAGNAGGMGWRSRYLVDSTGSYSVEWPAAADSACCFEDGTVPVVTGITFAFDNATGAWSYSS